jgi:hypothetical protein
MAAGAWLFWQFLDSAFPTGGFAHSGGLEAARQHGEVAGRAGLEGWLATSLAQLAHGSLPWVCAAHREPARLAELDELSDAFLTNHVANRASRVQGRALWLAVERSFASLTPPAPEPPRAPLTPPPTWLRSSEPSAVAWISPSQKPPRALSSSSCAAGLPQPCDSTSWVRWPASHFRPSSPKLPRPPSPGDSTFPWTKLPRPRRCWTCGRGRRTDSIPDFSRPRPFPP